MMVKIVKMDDFRFYIIQHAGKSLSGFRIPNKILGFFKVGPKAIGTVEVIAGDKIFFIARRQIFYTPCGKRMDNMTATLEFIDESMHIDLRATVEIKKLVYLKDAHRAYCTANLAKQPTIELVVGSFH